jgi:hypothetical protein
MFQVPEGLWNMQFHFPSSRSELVKSWFYWTLLNMLWSPWWFFPACWSAWLERHVAIMHKLSYNEFQHDSFLLGVAKWIGCMNNLNEIQELFQFSFCESLNYFKYATQNQVPGFD